MSKSKGGITCSPFKDAVMDTPGQKGVLGGMGKPLSAGPGETKGEISGVQFANIAGGEAGTKSFMKVSGKNTGPRG